MSYSPGVTGRRARVCIDWSLRNYYEMAKRWRLDRCSTALEALLRSSQPLCLEKPATMRDQAAKRDQALGIDNAWVHVDEISLGLLVLSFTLIDMLGHSSTGPGVILYPYGQLRIISIYPEICWPTWNLDTVGVGFATYVSRPFRNLCLYSIYFPYDIRFFHGPSERGKMEMQRFQLDWVS